MSDLRTFSKRIRKRGSNVSSDTDQLVRKVILAVDQAVVLSTPVDTGRARANWQPSIGEMITTTLPEPESPSAGAGDALARGQFVAAAYKGDGSPIVHITNNLPYITPLNEGHSKQAPIGFVEIAIMRALSVFKSARIVRESI